MKLKSSSVGILLSPLMKCFLLGLTFPYMLSISKEATFYSFLLGSILSLIPFSIILYIINKEPDKTLIGKIKSNFSKPISFIIINILILFCVITTFILLWELNSFIANEFLSETPTILILLVILIPILYLSIYNFDVLSRFSMMNILIGAFILIFNFYGLSKNFDLNNLSFITKNNITPFIKSAIHYSLISSIPCICITMIPKNDIVDKQNYTRSLIHHYLYSLFMSALIFLSVQLSLNIKLLEKYTYPEFIVLQLISIFNFIEHTESFAAILWFIYMIIAINASTIFIKYVIIETYNIKNKKVIRYIGPIIIGVIALFCIPLINYSFYLDNMPLSLIPFTINLIIFIFLIVLSLKYLFKKQK